MDDPNTPRVSRQAVEPTARPLICELLDIWDDADLVNEWCVLRGHS